MNPNMKNKILFLLPLLITANAGYAQNLKVLLFFKTKGYHHPSIEAGIPAIVKLGQEHNFGVDTTTDAAKMTQAFLKPYAAVIFLSTTGDILNNEQQAVFENYIRRGGGFVGIHAATDAERQWHWYGNLVGAYFVKHPAQQLATLNVVDSVSEATRHLPRKWLRKDEWYNFNWLTSEKIHVLITIDENSYNPGLEKMGYHPLSWYHDYDGGRAFYTELGHTDASYVEPLYLQHLLGGIEYAMGRKKME
jgi:type 1 glutamine amidotransferase